MGVSVEYLEHHFLLATCRFDITKAREKEALIGWSSESALMLDPVAKMIGGDGR